MAEQKEVEIDIPTRGVPLRAASSDRHAPTAGRGNALSSEEACVHGGRISRPDMLMIGGTGRNSGKTELACQIIRRQATSGPVVGLKVTTVDRTEGGCPSGGSGCGVCSSLTVPWLLTRETRTEPPKDSCRLLASGADQVHWLRVHASALREAAAAVVETIPAGSVCVCESASLSQAIEPGLFLQVHLRGRSRIKESAKKVAHLVDHLVLSDGAGFDLELDRISVLDGQWTLRRDASAVVLTNQSSECPTLDPDALPGRLGRLRQQLAQVIVSSRSQRPQNRSADTESLTVDERQRCGSLLDLAHALSLSDREWTLVMRITDPTLSPGAVNAMFRRRSGADAVVIEPTTAQVRQPLLGLYHHRVLSTVIAALHQGASELKPLEELCAVRQVTFGPPVAHHHRSGRDRTLGERTAR